MGVSWYFIVVLIWISLMINGVKCLFVCLLAILWRNVQTLCPFLNYVFVVEF